MEVVVPFLKTVSWTLFLTLVLSACASSLPHSKDQADLKPQQETERTLALLRQHVRYVFVLYQENRSFDSYFGTFPGADGLFSKPTQQTPGFRQTIINTDGSASTIEPFRIGPQEYASDTDDVDHSHALLAEKMDVQNGHAQMDRFALTEEKKYAHGRKPTLLAKQFGELTMAYVDGDTIPFLWYYAQRFVLFDHIFQTMVGPSTPGNLSIIAAQSGQTQAALHPDQAYKGNGGQGEPVVNDDDPFWGSPQDTSPSKMPVNPHDFPGYPVQLNQTYATLPLSFSGGQAQKITSLDQDPALDLSDVADDIAYLTQQHNSAVPWAWFEEGYDQEPTDAGTDPTDAAGLHASYITHHNGPQYFGYIANNPQLRAHLLGLDDFFKSVQNEALSPQGGVYYIKGGYRNIAGLKPADPDPAVQKNFLGDDDHPGYSDAQISEALVARAVNAIAHSPYWGQCAIIITWDDSEGDYDHVPPPVRSVGPDGAVLTDGPRVPLLLISPYARTQTVDHDSGDQGSVVQFVDTVFNLTPLAELPDEQKGRKLGKEEFHQADWGPDDALTPGVCDLVSAFDPDRLEGKLAPLAPSYAIIPENVVNVLPQVSGWGLKTLGIVPTDFGRKNPLPPDFNPRPKTDPSRS
ncbi:MAG: phosphoesterase [Spirochaetales bacterium]|nr:phosphoesterase [Spirochaetales bacterium]